MTTDHQKVFVFAANGEYPRLPKFIDIYLDANLNKPVERSDGQTIRLFHVNRILRSQVCTGRTCFIQDTF